MKAETQCDTLDNVRAWALDDELANTYAEAKVETLGDTLFKLEPNATQTRNVVDTLADTFIRGGG